MTIQEIKDNIRIRQMRDELGNRFVGEFTIGYSTNVVENPSPRELREIEEVIKESIIRTLYEDRRNELYEAVMDFCSCEPWNFGQLLQKRDALLKAARVQPPELKPT